MNIHHKHIWKFQNNNYIAYLPLPGVANPSVTRKGRFIYVTGSDEKLEVEYSYCIKMHEESSDNIWINYNNGMLLINTSSNNVELNLYGNRGSPHNIDQREMSVCKLDHKDPLVSKKDIAVPKEVIKPEKENQTSSDNKSGSTVVLV